jgi:alpha-ribazole phosphatase
MTRIFLVRHAPVDAPRGVIHGPRAPVDLSDIVGLAALKAVLPVAAPTFCSPARRTRDTALALRLDPTMAPEFREQDFGAWTGRRHDDIAASEGDAYHAFWQSPAVNTPPGGESFVDQVRRVADGLAKLPDGDVIAVVHSGTIRAALAIALDCAPEQVLRFVVDPLSLTRIDRLAVGWRVGAVNRAYLTGHDDVSRLPGNAPR